MQSVTLQLLTMIGLKTRLVCLITVSKQDWVKIIVGMKSATLQLSTMIGLKLGMQSHKLSTMTGLKTGPAVYLITVSHMIRSKLQQA